MIVLRLEKEYHLDLPRMSVAQEMQRRIYAALKMGWRLMNHIIAAKVLLIQEDPGVVSLQPMHV